MSITPVASHISKDLLILHLQNLKNFWISGYGRQMLKGIHNLCVCWLCATKSNEYSTSECYFKSIWKIAMQLLGVRGSEITGNSEQVTLHIFNDSCNVCWQWKGWSACCGRTRISARWCMCRVNQTIHSPWRTLLNFVSEWHRRWNPSTWCKPRLSTSSLTPVIVN